MKTFHEWLENLFRVDRERLDFSNQDSLGNYAFVRNGSGRVDDPNNLPAWAKGGQMRRGLFAGRYKQVLSYMIPRNIPYVVAGSGARPTLYLNKKDLPAIKSYRPWLSSFEKGDFSDTGKDGREEYFSEKPGRPIRQAQMKKDPISILQKNYEIQLVDDVALIRKDLDARGVDNEAEGLPPGG